MPGVGGTLQTNAKQEITVVPPAVVTAFNEGLFLAGTVAKLGAPIGQGNTIPFLQNREIDLVGFSLDWNMGAGLSAMRFNIPAAGAMQRMILDPADFSTGLDVQANDNQQTYLFTGRNFNAGNSAQTLWQLMNDGGVRLYGGVGSSGDSDYPDTGFLAASADMQFDTETLGSKYGFKFAGVEQLTFEATLLSFFNTVNADVTNRVSNTNAGAVARALFSAVSNNGGQANVIMHSSANAGQLANCAWFTSLGATRMRVGPTDATVMDFVSGGIRYARLLSTGEFMVGRDSSSAAVYRFQVGEANGTRGALFNPANALAVAARHTTGGNVFFGARTNTPNPDAVITNNLFTEILTITDGGAIQTVAPTGGVSAAGQWQLGSVVAAVVVTDLANYVEINIGGTLRKLQLCN